MDQNGPKIKTVVKFKRFSFFFWRFDMFHVLRPGYTIPQNHNSRPLPSPQPQILETWKMFEKFCDPGTSRPKSEFPTPPPPILGT